MSNNKELTTNERKGLIAAGLPVDTPSQLSDAFRLGMSHLQAQNDELLVNYLKAHSMNVRLCSSIAPLHLSIEDEELSEKFRLETVKIIDEFRVDNLTKAQTLADIRAEAVMSMFNHCKQELNHEHGQYTDCVVFEGDAIKYTNQLKEGEA